MLSFNGIFNKLFYLGKGARGPLPKSPLPKRYQLHFFSVNPPHLILFQRNEIPAGYAPSWLAMMRLRIGALGMRLM